MKRLLPIALVTLTMACASKEWMYKGMHDGVDVSYRWSHPTGRPSELLLRLENTTAEDRQARVVIDLYYQGLTVETFTADTCIKAGQTLNRRMNGIYFIPARLTTEQIRSGDAKAEMTRSTIQAGACP